MYQALYRKWRPITFSQVVGQQHITDTLQRQVAEGRTGHAYLFTGTRGTGKTTCARILAKAINCLHPVDGAPCNQCESCRGIDAGKLLDITELDAASNNGVDNVRALREEAVYTPSVLKKRVYIIDEVHMLSTPAFNALLKILEEPPEHLVFILATTELHKVPATILSRCQRFSFKRILPQDIARQLLYIAGEEHIDLSPDGADILARMANGAMRDALSLLDQCRSFEGTLNSAAILELLGLAGGVQTAQLMEFILRRSTQDALLHFDRLYRDGKDIAALLRELSDLGRDLLIRRTAPQGGAALLTGLYDENTLAALGELASGHRLIYLLDVLGQTQTALSGSSSLRTEAELCLMKLCDESLCGDLSALTARLERLEKAAAKGLAVPISAAPAAPAASQTQAPPPAPTAPARTESPAPTAPASPKPEPKADPAPQAQAPKPEPITPVPQPETSLAGGDSGIWDRLK
ncbi:MAG: DNA polymerase III subunit gamma/tau, partial [Clostridiales bacterium]|nr:DNA polymerase III subunit gamma/tau [Clostridiales bacterium]